MDYRIQRLKEDLTNAQQRNKKQRIQLSNYKKVHERDLETIKKYKEVIDKIKEYIEKHDYDYIYMDCKFIETEVYKELLDILKEVE